MCNNFSEMDRLTRKRIRIKMLVQEAGNQRQLAEAADTAPDYLSQLLKGKKHKISPDICDRLEKAARKPNGWIDQWLPEELASDSAAAALAALGAIERTLLKNFRCLPEDQQKHHFQTIELSAAHAVQAEQASLSLRTRRRRRA
jgi:transcriptional regulator with XRE-family HTH domain